MNTNQGFDPFAFSKLYEWEKDNFWFVSRNDRIIYLAKEYLKEPFQFLEVGCGTGFVIEGLHRNFLSSTLKGSEFYAEGLEFAKLRNPILEFFQMDARSIPFENYFDAIGAFDVIEHIEEDELVLQQMNKSLKKEGLLLITVPQHKFLWSQMDELAHHKRRYTKKELVDKVNRAGFEIINVNSFTSLLFPLIFASRFFQKKKANPDSEFNITPFMNSLLKVILRIEFTLVRLGMQFPFGGSLVLLGRKK